MSPSLRWGSIRILLRHLFIQGSHCGHTIKIGVDPKRIVCPSGEEREAVTAIQDPASGTLGCLEALLPTPWL